MKTYEKNIKSSYNKNILFKVEHFESILELTKVNQSRAVKDCWKDKGLKSECIRRSWYGVDSIDEAYKLLSCGWTQGTEKAAHILKDIKTAERKKITFTNNVHGFVPNVALALMNVPNSMIDVKQTATKSKVLNIVYSNCATCDVESDELIEAGVNVVSTILDLEQSGYRCNVSVLVDSCNGDSCDLMLVNVKNANQTLNLKKMMFPLAHTAMLRVVSFDWQDKSPIANYKYGRGRPLYSKFNEEELTKNDLKKVLGDNTVFIDYKTAKRGKDAIKSALK